MRESIGYTRFTDRWTNCLDKGSRLQQRAVKAVPRQTAFCSCHLRTSPRENLKTHQGVSAFLSCTSTYKSKKRTSSSNSKTAVILSTSQKQQKLMCTKSSFFFFTIAMSYNISGNSCASLRLGWTVRVCIPAVGRILSESRPTMGYVHPTQGGSWGGEGNCLLVSV